MKIARRVFSWLAVILGGLTALLGSFEATTAYKFGFAAFEFRYEILVSLSVLLILANAPVVASFAKSSIERLHVGGYDTAQQFRLYTAMLVFTFLVFWLLPMHGSLVSWLKYRVTYIENDFEHDYADFLDFSAAEYYDRNNFLRASELWLSSQEFRPEADDVVSSNLQLVAQRRSISELLLANSEYWNSKIGSPNLLSFQLTLQSFMFDPSNESARGETEVLLARLDEARRAENACETHIWFVLGAPGTEDACLAMQRTTAPSVMWLIDDARAQFLGISEGQLESFSGSSLLSTFRLVEPEFASFERNDNPFMSRYLSRFSDFGFTKQDLYRQVDPYEYQ